MKKTILCILLFLQALCLYSFETEHVDGFMWKVEHDGNTVYLLGSIHLARPEIYPLPEAYETAFEASDFLVLELDMRKVNALTMMQRGMFAGEENLVNVLADSSFNMLWGYAGALGMDSLQFIKMKPWFATLTVLQYELIKNGFQPEYGIDMHFMKSATEQKKEVLELESFAFQLGMFEEMDKHADAYVYYTLHEVESLANEIDEMFEYWKQGDTDAMNDYIMKSIDLEDPDSRKLYQDIFLDRNENMAKKISGYLSGDEGKTYFVVVGSGHLVGDGGLIDLLGK